MSDTVFRRTAPGFIFVLVLMILCFIGYKIVMPSIDSPFDIAEPEAVGLSAEKVNQLVKDIQQGKFQQIHALLVYKQGKLVVEEYFPGNDDFIEFENQVTRNRSRAEKRWQADDLHYVASINKAMTSLLTGMVLHENAIDVNAKIYPFLPPHYQTYFQSAQLKSLSFRHLLQMELGINWDEWGGDDLKQLWQQDDFIPYLTAKPAQGPGTKWTYNSASSNLLLTILNHITGDIRAYAHRNLYAKLDMAREDYRWESQPTGIPEGAARLYMKPRDMMKIGVMLLNDGRWQGEQIVPEEWVAKLHSEKAPHNKEYSLGFWLYKLDGRPYLSANGDGGQYINLFEDEGLVVVMTQGNYLEHPLYYDQATEIMANYLLSPAPEAASDS